MCVDVGKLLARSNLTKGDFGSSRQHCLQKPTTSKYMYGQNNGS
jgi:hypothetical protein